MVYHEFVDFVGKKLKELSSERKDAWILEQAKLVPEAAQQDFLMSLTGEKKITYMPTEAEIEELCKKIQDGEICVEYETHYYEFDTDGRYMDDWKIWHNDPADAFPFLDRVFRGCGDLLHLGEYELARKILDKVCQLEFQVVEAQDTENFEDDSPFTIADAEKEKKLSMTNYEIGNNWLKALLLDKQDDSFEYAQKLLEVLKSEICRKLNLSDFRGLISEGLLDYMEKLLKKDIEAADTELERISDERRFWRERYEIEKKRARYQHLLLDLSKKCREQEKEAEIQEKASGLHASWKQIKELLRTLRYERVIDGQIEIEQVWDICQALVRRERFAKEDWKLRKEILCNIISNRYYDCYGCYEPLNELAGKLYVTEEETLEFAELLDKSGIYEREAAELYRQHGRKDKYVQYLETHLGESSKEYVELVQCYCDAGNKDGAREIAEQGLKKCRDDLTELFIFLLRDAKDCGEKERYKKLYASAKRRKGANIILVDKALA